MVVLTKPKFLSLVIKAITPLRPTSKQSYTLSRKLKKSYPKKQLFPSYKMEIKGILEDVIDDLREELWRSSVKSVNSRHIILESISSCYSYMYSISIHPCDELFDILLNVFWPACYKSTKKYLKRL